MASTLRTSANSKAALQTELLVHACHVKGHAYEVRASYLELHQKNSLLHAGLLTSCKSFCTLLAVPESSGLLAGRTLLARNTA